jgi:hypothetical protein
MRPKIDCPGRGVSASCWLEAKISAADASGAMSDEEVEALFLELTRED